ncbi:MAG: MBL fold metallo-hydrolase [Acidobacteria bacterium]|nr:MBL fold metallo-hydrolase [Acidobacteriota bacterium]
MKNSPLFLRAGAALLALAGVLWNQQVYPPGEGVQLGRLPHRWITGGPRCMEVPDWQVHEYNPDFYILRQSGCTHFEKPFLYLIFGKEKAMLMDTGAGVNDVARIVFQTIAKWGERNKRSAMPLLVMHSHAHGDHIAGDKQFQNLPNVTFVAASVPELEKAFAIRPYPTGIGLIDLGGRKLDVIPIPGHEDNAVALYDRQTGILLSGDNLYPGRLSVRNWDAYVASAKRLTDFTEGKVITHVLGTHIEQKRTPFSDYVRGTLYQPEEHELALSRGHLLEWNDALQRSKDKPALLAMRDFTVIPRQGPRP